MLLFVCFASDAPPGAGALKPGHAVEDAVFFCQQLRGTAGFGDLAVGQDDDLVRRLDGTHPVSDDKYGLARKQA